MIAYIKGKILEKSVNFLVVENQGLGYKIFVTPEFLEYPLGAPIELFLYHKSSDDGQALFGLPDFPSLQFFEQLITVSGVGPKMALSILSAAKMEAVRDAIARQDASIFTRISGVGTKTAEKIIVELKNKVGAVSGSGASSEVFDALVALGYSQKEVREAVGKLNSDTTTGEQIKEALKLLGKG